MSPSSCTGKLPTSDPMGTNDAGRGMKLGAGWWARKSSRSQSRVTWVSGFLSSDGDWTRTASRGDAYPMVLALNRLLSREECARCAARDCRNNDACWAASEWPMAAKTKREISTVELNPKLPVPMLEKPVS